VSLRFGLLGLLAAESLHGYEIKQRFEDMLGGTWELNIGSVYQALQRLERDGLVEPVGDRGDRGKQRWPSGSKASTKSRSYCGKRSTSRSYWERAETRTAPWGAC